MKHSRHITKRALIRLTLLIAAGAIVNIAVAWIAPYAFGEKHQIGWANGTPSYQWDPVGDTRRGWPMAALWTELPYESGVSRGTALEFHSEDGSRIELGCWPIWPGFAINTVFYAALIWMLFAVPAALRRKRRRARGLCAKCGYDLRGGGGAGVR